MTSARPVVSVVIPCYNAEPWIEEAVDSCLEQTYRPIEVIVIDDGSTDRSLIALQNYSARIVLETGANRGANYARNRGFELSSGDYVQFLDADDYLLPTKVERQVSFLARTGADVVYGDWRHQYHRPDGTSYLGEICQSGAQRDILKSLLDGWWVAPLAILYRRQAVVQSGGWDKSLRAGQDRDFFISVAMSGAEIGYQPGCQSIYRRYGSVTVSTSNNARWVANHRRLLLKAESRLSELGRLSLEYRRALARSFFHLARASYDLDRARYRQLLDKALSLDPDFRAQESTLYNLASRILGFAFAEGLASRKRWVIRQITKHGTESKRGS